MINESLSEMSNEAIWETVLLPHLGHEHDWTAITASDQVERVREIMVAKSNELNAQLAARNADLDALRGECMAEGRSGKARYFKAKTEHDEWRARALHFKRMVESRAAEVKTGVNRVRRERHDRTEQRVYNGHRDALRQIAYAIANHQDACRADDLNPTSADVKLWGVLDEIEVPVNGRPVSLSVMLEDIWSDSAA